VSLTAAHKLRGALSGPDVARCPQRLRSAPLARGNYGRTQARVRTGPAHGREEPKDAPMTLVPGR
jgi:hypothetical protein